MRDIAVWAIGAVMVAGIAARPWRVAEWLWAVGGAALLTALGLVAPAAAGRAAAGGAEVYLFLAGMLLLSRVLLVHGVFEWIAAQLARRAGRSRALLFVLLYGLGVVVTALLSNDATIVLLAPAVLAAGRYLGEDRLPYLYACAFVANAASFVLPISNPANLVVFRGLPPIGAWVALFGLSAVASVLLCGLLLMLVFRRALREELHVDGAAESLDAAGRLAFAAVTLATLCVVGASAAGAPVGLTAAVAAVACALLTLWSDPARGWRAVRCAPWGILPLVAGLFVMVAAIDATGALGYARSFFRSMGSMPHWQGVLAAGGAVAFADNVMNNLPAGLLVRYTLSVPGIAPHIAHAALIGIDLGPNLSITGSLATILWVMILRADGIEIGLLRFLRIGAAVVIPTLAVALLLVH